VPRSIEAYPYNEVSPYVTVLHTIIMDTEAAEASGIPTSFVIDIDINDPTLDQYPTFTVRRKAAKRSERWYQNSAAPLLIPARKRRRLEEPLLPPPTSTDEGASNTASAELSEGPPPPTTAPSTDTVDASTRCQSPRETETQLQRTETSVEQVDDDVRELPGSLWGDRLRELADYRKIQGHCNVPQKYSENIKLGRWVNTQRKQYNWHLEGKTSSMTNFRIQALESLDFEWTRYGGTATWEDRLSELADYRKVHGHCNVPYNYSENNKLGKWVSAQRTQYRFRLQGKPSPMTLSRIQELESLGFEWDSRGTAWKDRLSELVDYRKIDGHCNVPMNYSENPQLGTWVSEQRKHYNLQVKGMKSHMTLSRIQALESLDFEWDCYGAAWKDHLSGLADYRKEHGHCNVPQKYSENLQLGRWVSAQRSQYRLHLEGKPSPMTTFRIQELESLSFEWKSSVRRDN
jgi:hypothetical protein